MIRKSVTVINDFSGGQDTKTPILYMPLNKSPNMRNFHCAGVRERLIKRGGYAKVNSTEVESDNLCAYYPPGYCVYDYPLRTTATYTEIGQGFKVGLTTTVTKVKLWLKKTGTPGGTDTVTLEIQTDSSGKPSGSVVTNGTSAAVDISDTITTTYAWVTFTFAVNPTLTAGTQYHLVLTGAFTISDTAYISWGADNYDVVYPNGSMSKYDGSTYTVDTNYNACFEVYITAGLSGNDAVALWDFSSKNMLLGIFGTTLYRMDKGSTGTPDGVWDSVGGSSAWDTYTKSMLHFNGSDEATTFTDEIGKTWTAAGSAQLDTAQYKFSTASGLFNGTDSYITTPDSDDFNIGSGDFTIDFWLRPHTFGTGNDGICGQYEDDDNFWGIEFEGAAGGNLYFVHKDAGTVRLTFAAAHGMDVDTWYHVALVRNGNTFTFYVNGASIGSTTDADAVHDFSAVLSLGKDRSAGYYDGWIDEFRFSKGIARWTANFTPETSAYSAAALPLTSSRFWTFADWQSGRALINTDIGLYTYTGTGVASLVSAAPRGKFLTVWRNYAFIFGLEGYPNNGRYCDLSDYTTWTASNSFSNAFNTNDGDVITGVRTLKGKLYVFKRYSIFRVTYLGSKPTFQVDQVQNIGCPCHYTIKEVDLGGDVGRVLIFLTSDKKLAIFDGYNIQIINDVLTEKTNDLFASADDQPLSFSDMNFTHIDKFHASVKEDTNEYILYCVMGTDTTVGYAFVFDYKLGGVYPYDNQVFASSCVAVSTSKVKKLYCGGYTGYMWLQESGNSDDGTAISAYWVSGKIKPQNAATLLNKNLLLGINTKYITSGSTININFQYRFNQAVSWTTAQTFSLNHNDELNFGKTTLFDIGSISNMLQVKLKDSSSNPAPTIYSIELIGNEVPLGVSLEDKATA